MPKGKGYGKGRRKGGKRGSKGTKKYYVGGYRA